MQPHKSFITKFGELIDQHYAEQHSAVETPSQSGRASRLIRWLLPNGGTLILIALLIATQSVWARNLQSPTAPGPSATTVNYQGRLADSGGTPITGSRAMTFAIYDAASTGSLIWGPETHAAIPVSNGLFSVGLGSQTSGGIPTTAWNGDRYLEITVGGETLSPRELIRSVPIAGMALTVPDGSIVSNSLNLDHGTVCLSSSTQVNILGNWQDANIPGLNTSFTLSKPSQVLVWIDGLAEFSQPTEAEIDVILVVDNVEQRASIGWDARWFNVKGQRIINLSAGSHSLAAKAHGVNQGLLTVHGSGNYATCINCLVLGDQ